MTCNLWIQLMNFMKLVIPLHSLYWSIHTKDESKCGSAFAFIFGVNWLWRCGVTALFEVFFYEMKCNGMASFMEFMTGLLKTHSFLLRSIQGTKRHVCSDYSWNWLSQQTPLVPHEGRNWGSKDPKLNDEDGSSSLCNGIPYIDEGPWMFQQEWK